MRRKTWLKEREGEKMEEHVHHTPTPSLINPGEQDWASDVILALSVKKRETMKKGERMGENGMAWFELGLTNEEE